MFETLDQSPPPADPDVRAFVLRIRTDSSAVEPRRDIIDLEDVRTMKVWRVISLEQAFERIRLLIGRGGTSETGPPG